jgi:spore maturation protein SpmA
MGKKERCGVIKEMDAVIEPLVKKLMKNYRSGNELLGCFVRSASLFISLEMLKRVSRGSKRKKS